MHRNVYSANNLSHKHLNMHIYKKIDFQITYFEYFIFYITVTALIEMENILLMNFQ